MEAPESQHATRGGGVRRRLVATGLLCALVLTMAGPARADVTPADINEADRRVEAAIARLGDAEARLQTEQRRLERVRDSIDRIGERMEVQAAAILAETDEARDRVARMYMIAGITDAVTMLTTGPNLPTQVAYLGALADQDQQFVNRLVASRADLERLRETIRQQMADQEAVIAVITDEMEVLAAEVEAARAEATGVRQQWERQEEERRRREEEERRRQEEEERRRQEEEERRRREAEQAMAAAAAAAAGIGWTPTAGVEPWRPLVAAYFPPERVDEALAIMRCESNGDPTSVNRYSGAAGLFQHLPYSWPSRSVKAGWEGADIFDPEANVAVAAWLVSQSGSHKYGPWGHWTCRTVLE